MYIKGIIIEGNHGQLELIREFFENRSQLFIKVSQLRQVNLEAQPI